MTEPNLKTIEDILWRIIKQVDSVPATEIVETALKAILSTHIPKAQVEVMLEAAIGEDDEETTIELGLLITTGEDRPSVIRNALRKEQRLALKHLIEEKLK